MSRRRQTTIAAAAAVAALCASVAVEAAAPRELRSLFPRQAAVTVEGEGLARLELPPEVLAACRPDLSDLRILDAGGDEVPYLVDSGLPPETVLEAGELVVPEVAGVARETVERDSAPDLFRETYTLAIPEAARGREGWSLVFSADRQRFVREVRVTAEGTALVEGASIFRLPEPGTRNDRIDLPALSAATLEVTLSGQDGGFLEPAMRLQTTRTLASGQRAVVPLEIVGRPGRRERRTEVELARPRGLVPDLIRVATTTPFFSRQVQVWDEGAGATTGSGPLGVATFYRLEAAPELESLEMRVRAARGDRLRLVIDDGDSPALENLQVEAVVRRPALVFSLPAASGREATLLFGGGRAYRPRYDLAGLPPPSRVVRTGEAARLGERLFDPAALAAATLGPPRANPAFDPAPALAFAMDAGAEISPKVFEHRVAVDAGESSEGLYRLRVEPPVAARARPDLGDLRVIDAENRQYAYLLEPDAAAAELPIAIGEPVTEDGVSSYALPLPVAPVVVDQVSLDSDKEFFDRAFELVGVSAADGDEVVVASGRLARRPGDPRKLRLDCRRQRLEALELRVRDRDDAPLSFFDVEVRVPAADLYFAAPSGGYSLLLGNPDADPPRYELARVRDLVLAVEAAPVAASEVAENPEFRASARFTAGTALQRLLLWVALIVAVLVLAWFTLRLPRGAGRDD